MPASNKWTSFPRRRAECVPRQIGTRTLPVPIAVPSVGQVAPEDGGERVPVGDAEDAERTDQRVYVKGIHLAVEHALGAARLQNVCDQANGRCIQASQHGRLGNVLRLRTRVSRGGGGARRGGPERKRVAGHCRRAVPVGNACLLHRPRRAGHRCRRHAHRSSTPAVTTR